jgi:hypothetical protein
MTAALPIHYCINLIPLEKNLNSNAD